MKKYIIGLLFLYSGFCYSQTPDTLNWKQNRLTWDDFKGTPTSSHIINSRLNFNIEYSFTRDQKQANIYRFQVKNYINRKYSWIDPSYKNSLMLLYNQTIFDIAELYSRKIQFQLNRTIVNPSNIEKTADSVYNKYFFECQDKINEFQISSDFGKNEEIIKSWSDSIFNELLINPKEYIPDYKISKFGYGIDFFSGTSIFNGPINSMLNNPFNYGYGFEASYSNFFLHLRTTFSNSSLKQDYNGKYFWDDSLKIASFQPDITLSYRLFNNRKFDIRPFAGITWYAISPNSFDSTYIDQKVSTSSLLFGINLDYKIRQSISYNFILKEETYLCIRTRIYFIPVNIDQSFKGSSINMSFGISGLGHHIILKNGK